MQLGDILIAPAPLATEGTQNASLLAPELYESVTSIPLELLILSWDQFVNELEFE